MNTKISILSIVTMAFFTACGGGGGSGGSPISQTQNISGNVIDGYVQGATVTVGGLTKQTDANGYYSFANVPFTQDMVITASGGTDVTTGEAYEGVVKAVVEKDVATVAITPLTTLVTSSVESGVSLADANTNIAAKLGITEATLKADPIEQLNSGNATQKADAAKAIKKALVVQKMAETIASSASTDTASHSAIFDSVMDTVSDLLQTSTFDAVLADTTTITTNTATKLVAKTDVNIANISEKLAASKDAAAKVVTQAQDINETALATATDAIASLKSTAKALEVITQAIETSVKTIATSNDVAEINAKISEIAKTTNTIAMLGGVDGIAAKVKTQEDTLGSGQTIDASTFSEELFSSSVIAEQSALFDNLKTLGMTDDMIAQVGTKAQSDASSNIANIISSVIDNTPDANISDAAKTTITNEFTSSVTKANDAVQNTSIGSSNTTPIANAGVTQSVYTDELVTLDGSKSSDSDANTLTYLWSIASKPTNSTVTLSNTSIVNPTFTPDMVGDYVLSLTINDGTVDSLESNVTINASIINLVPISNAGTSKSVNTKGLVTLNGSKSSDGNGDTLTYLWSTSSVPTNSTVTLSNTSIVNPTFTPDVEGDYVFNLIVNDGTVNSTTSTITITVDTITPTIISISPSNLEERVTLNKNIVVTFIEDMNSSTMTKSYIILKDENDNVIDGTMTYQNKVATFNPAVDLEKLTAFTIYVSENVSDIIGNKLGLGTTTTFKSGEKTLENMTYNSTTAWVGKTISYDGLTQSRVGVTLPVGSFSIYAEESTANTDLETTVGILVDTNGDSLESDISGVNAKTTTDISPAMVQITNDSGANKTYIIPVSTKNKFSNNNEASNIWVGVIKDVTTPTYTIGGTLSLGDVTTNTTTILAKAEIHNWFFTTPADGAGDYTLSVTSTSDVNLLKNFEIKLIDGATDMINWNVSTGSFSKANTTLAANHNYQVTITSTTNTARDSLGVYTIKLIKQ